MTHYDEGNYAAKHPQGITPDQKIAEQVKAKLVDGKISCAAAFQIAEEYRITPAEVGQVIDLLEIRINKCQLGLFGYGPQKKIVQPAKQIAGELRDAIEDACNDGKLSCAVLWEIAERLHISRLDASAACEALGVKISSCQLGAFSA
ncbi:hypothetical protein U27_00071 [Candidatus Vecturithrix granuli]|uniref:Uncharacterized protein n=1 Tax=Vecturithrix granuli TaxID=1499967 RepID=A0A081C6H5_VECG1|nr:hypothetical protein U27_00071 [Candidatus Vecturithrix granuli]